mgnify:CR=1 FL=1
MGMFDYVEIKENKLDIPAGEYQTKALNCYLDNYIVNENLELVCVESDYEKLDISTHIIGDCKKANVALMRLEMHVMQY